MLCYDAHLLKFNHLRFALSCTLLLSAVFASPAVTDAENAIASLAHPHGAQYSFRLSDSDASAAETVGAFHHIPVCKPCCLHQLKVM
jgi:hypothetical protein